jgi:hypothetical protein
MLNNSSPAQERWVIGHDKRQSPFRDDIKQVPRELKLTRDNNISWVANLYA